MNASDSERAEIASGSPDLNQQVCVLRLLYFTLQYSGIDQFRFHHLYVMMKITV